MNHAIKSDNRTRKAGALSDTASLPNLLTDVIDPSQRYLREADKGYSGERCDTIGRDLSLAELRPARGSRRVGFAEFLD